MLQNILHFGYFHLSWIAMKKSEIAMDIEKTKKYYYCHYYYHYIIIIFFLS